MILALLRLMVILSVDHAWQDELIAEVTSRIGQAFGEASKNKYLELSDTEGITGEQLWEEIFAVAENKTEAEQLIQCASDAGWDIKAVADTAIIVTDQRWPR